MCIVRSSYTPTQPHESSSTDTIDLSLKLSWVHPDRHTRNVMIKPDISFFSLFDDGG